MRILQINAVYAKSSTGRTTREMHEYLLEHGYDSYIAAPDLAGLSSNCYKIGNTLDYKLHALYYRITGKQAYSSQISTKKLLNWIKKINPDIIILRNLHGNYINLPMLARFINENNIATIIVLHDSWFITGGCTYYIAPQCYKWKESCGKCPALHNDIKSCFFDSTSKVLEDRKRMLGNLKRLSIIGVSQWVTDDAKKSVLKNAFRIQCIYNWIDLNIFYPRDRNLLKHKYGFGKNQFIILGVSASWSAAKGINLFHELANILPPELKIVLIGNSESLTEKHPNITYLKATNNITQLAEMYAMADVYVNPTIQETFGKTTAEALSCGTPVVAYNGTATPELIGTDEKCGYLINELKATLFSEKIIEIYKKGVNQYTLQCRNRAELLFNMETNIKKYISLFHEMLN